MNAVWSYWLQPKINQISWQWHSDKFFWLCWVLSVMYARSQFKKLFLYCDKQLSNVLYDVINLPFDHIENIDMDLNNYSDKWWMISKPIAYLKQKEPFIHIECDSFLTQPLPVRISSAALFAQNPEYFLANKDHLYNFNLFERTEIISLLPEEWNWARKMYFNHQKAIACGIFGGQHLEFIHYYAESTLNMIKKIQPYIDFDSLNNPINPVLMVEQFYLAAIFDFHNFKSDSKFDKFEIEYLFPSFKDAIQPINDFGYIHLMGPMKSNPQIIERIEAKVAEIYPEFYCRILQFLEDAP